MGAAYPSQLVRRRLLADRRTVTVRPIRPDDAEALRRFFDGLSRAARSSRFKGAAVPPDEPLVRFYTDVDYDRHMAFVCETQEQQIIGEARYVANPDGRSCELAIAVADDWRHSGVAQLLMDALTRFARTRGFETMEGLVLRGNEDMLKFAGALGFEASSAEEEPASVRIVRKL
jgi:acetyltransferase